MQNSQQIALAKQALRHEYLARRKMMPNSSIAVCCREICQRLGAFLADYFAQNPEPDGAVLSYLAYGQEVNLAELHRELWRRGRRLAVPRTAGLPAGRMEARFLREDTELEKSPLGVREPTAAAEICPPGDLAAVLLPGVAFDLRGGRLGHGAGYYDRFLEPFGQSGGPLLVGVAYEWQVAPEVPLEPWDQPLDYLLTEKCLREFKRR